MAGLIKSSAVQFGIKGTKSTSRKKTSKKYKELVNEANERIKLDNQRYARAYEKALAYRAQ